MAFFCRKGLKWECDGCGCCRYTDIEGECASCRKTVYIGENFEYIDNKLYCEDCADDIQAEAEEED